MGACPECGFDDEDTTIEQARDEVCRGADEIAAALGGEAGEVLVRRPSPAVWSPLEYACHVRDVLLVQRERALLALVEDDPSFASMHRDERATTARYAAEPPRAVAAQVPMAAHLLVWLFDGLDEEQRGRPCRYPYPELAPRTIGWLLVRTAHEVVHHAGDVRRGLG